MGRIIRLVYGLLSYAFFFVTFLYAVGFVDGLGVPKTIDIGGTRPSAGGARCRPRRCWACSPSSTA